MSAFDPKRTFLLRGYSEEKSARYRLARIFTSRSTYHHSAVLRSRRTLVANARMASIRIVSFCNSPRNERALRQSDGLIESIGLIFSASTVVEGLGIGTWHGPAALAWKRAWCHPGDAARHLPLPTAGSVGVGQRYYRRQSHRPLLWSLDLRPLDSLWGLGPCPLGPWFDCLPSCSIGPTAAPGAIDHAGSAGQR